MTEHWQQVIVTPEFGNGQLTTGNRIIYELADNYSIAAMLKDILHKFIVIDGVTSVHLIRDDGEVVDGLETGDIDDNQLAAVVSFVMAESKAMALKLCNDPLTMVYLEFRDYLLLSSPLTGQLFIVIIVKPSANIALVMAELKKNRDTIIQQL
ncbi:MAG TPA: roadblock/LC7 domain-containing protein [Methanoregulaceae archaeon]|nr:roadblock/LC7 domain-containing protein [Methanoregulaceae archaeon]